MWGHKIDRLPLEVVVWTCNDLVVFTRDLVLTDLSNVLEVEFQGIEGISLLGPMSWVRVSSLRACGFLKCESKGMLHKYVCSATRGGPMLIRWLPHCVIHWCLPLSLPFSRTVQNIEYINVPKFQIQPLDTTVRKFGKFRYHPNKPIYPSTP